MTPEEQEIAEKFYAAIQQHSNFSARSLQAKSFRVGVSDLGFCSERTRRMLDQQVPEDRDVLPAFIGTALGDEMEKAAVLAWPEAVTQGEVEVELTGDRQTYNLLGHFDILLPEGYLLDCKTTFGLSNVERTGASQQQRFQRHMYAKGAHAKGMFADGVALEDIKVGNVWMDRGGVERRLHVEVEPYDPDVVASAGRWLDDVVYAYLQQEEARKEPPREMCAKVCGFYEVCRAYDTDVEGLLTEPSVLTAVDLAAEGARLVREGYRLKDEAKAELEGINGSTGDYNVRWTWVNESVVPATTRKGYYKLDVRKVPSRKRVQGK